MKDIESILKTIGENRDEYFGKFYTIEDNKIRTYDVVRISFCDYNKDECGNEIPIRGGVPDIEYTIQRRDLAKGTITKWDNVNKNTIGKKYFRTPEELMKSLMENAG